jgi:hypothetical protein
MGDQPGDREESRMSCKAYDIPKALIWRVANAAQHLVDGRIGDRRVESGGAVHVGNGSGAAGDASAKAAR